MQGRQTAESASGSMSLPLAHLLLCTQTAPGSLPGSHLRGLLLQELAEAQTEAQRFAPVCSSVLLGHQGLAPSSHWWTLVESTLMEVWRSLSSHKFYCPDISLLVLMPLAFTVQTPGQPVHELSLCSPESGSVAGLSISWSIWQKLYTLLYSPSALKIFEMTKKRWSTALFYPMR